MYESYRAAGSPHKRMSQFYNVIKPCLINPEDLSLPIDNVIPPPELHLHIGLANWAWELVKQLLGDGRYEELVQWCSHRSITIHGYHGSGLDGGNSKNFFKASKDLHLLLGQHTAAPITDMLEKFDMVTKACFSRDLLPGWKETLDVFITSVWELIAYCKFKLGITLCITWKVHIMVAHLKCFLEEKNWGGFGRLK